jgi:hypothetical protein
VPTHIKWSSQRADHQMVIVRLNIVILGSRSVDLSFDLVPRPAVSSVPT